MNLYAILISQEVQCALLPQNVIEKLQLF